MPTEHFGVESNGGALRPDQVAHGLNDPACAAHGRPDATGDLEVRDQRIQAACGERVTPDKQWMKADSHSQIVVFDKSRNQLINTLIAPESD